MLRGLADDAEWVKKIGRQRAIVVLNLEGLSKAVLVCNTEVSLLVPVQRWKNDFPHLWIASFDLFFFSTLH